MGYGLVKEDGDSPWVVKCGVLTARRDLSLGERLHHLYTGLLGIMETFPPDEVAVEDPFVSVNARTAMAVGQAQGLALMAAAARSVPVSRYSPRQVKLAVSGHGGATKEQVQQAIRMQVDLDDAAMPEDASDALAVALCHLQNRREAALMARESM